MIKSVYIHIPFCKNICSYCDFCKVLYNKKWINSYLESLSYEIKNNYKEDMLDTIYIGGGTPSSLDIEELNKLFSIIKIFNLNKKFEFTIECNVEDITEEKLKLFKDNNINRLSIGIESFNDKYLKYLNRNYNSDIIFDKIKLAKKYFDNINIDLIYAIENQSLEELKSDLDKIKSLDICHVSCYSIIIEKNTILYNNKTKTIDQDLDYEMYKLINKELGKIFNQYEVSNYSKKGYVSMHNLNYWKNNEYYGFGLSAAGYIGNIRYTNTKNLAKYINKVYDREEEKITIDDKMKYELILGFRLNEGINKNIFKEKYNVDIMDIYNIKNLINKGYLINEKDNIKVNKEYFYVLNDILVNFV